MLHSGQGTQTHATFLLFRWKIRSLDSNFVGNRTERKKMWNKITQRPRMAQGNDTGEKLDFGSLYYWSSSLLSPALLLGVVIIIYHETNPAPGGWLDLARLL